MTDRPRWFQTTAIDYPNSRPHIGTAFEKLGADVQARYRRMEGHTVTFLMGNDENTLKVADKAAELGEDPRAYCDRMAGEFRQVWDALDISYDVFVQTSHDRHKQCCTKFIQKVYDNGHIYKGSYEGWYCPGCEEFKSDKVRAENAGLCPIHKRPLVRREEACWYFRQSAFADRLKAHLEAHPDFVQPESRRNEMLGFLAEGLEDVNISRQGESWGIPVPFDPGFTIYVWFDALLTYITGIGYGDDEEQFNRLWPCDLHFIGKDITRFHCLLWPAMCWAAGIDPPRRVFSHGFVTVDGTKVGKSMGNVVQPLDIVSKSSVDAYRYFFLRECPYPGDGDYSGQRFEEVVNSELANNLGNLLSRCVTLITKNYDGTLAGVRSGPADPANLSQRATFVERVRAEVEACRYSVALQQVVQDFLTPTNQFLELNAPWKLVKTDKAHAAEMLYWAALQLRVAAILLKPFVPRSAEAIYTSFNFPQPWAEVRYADAAQTPAMTEDLRVTAPLVDGKLKPLFPRLG